MPETSGKPNKDCSALRCPLWVGSLFIGRNGRRSVILIICTVAVLLGLPRLAVYFREPQQFGMMLGSPGDRVADFKRVPAPGSNASAPTLSTTKQPVVQTGLATSSLPANEADLIVAIQRELARIGYYGGPITTAWTEDVRSAIRKVSGSTRTQPSQQLLMALRATKPDIKSNVTQKGATLNLQAAQDLINGRVPATRVDSPEDGLLSEGYLPPWPALRERYSQLAQSTPPGAGDEGALTLRVTARSSRAESRRRERVSRRRTYASAHRRSRVSFSPFGGFFAY